MNYFYHLILFSFFKNPVKIFGSSYFCGIIVENKYPSLKILGKCYTVVVAFADHFLEAVGIKEKRFTGLPG